MSIEFFRGNSLSVLILMILSLLKFGCLEESNDPKENPVSPTPELQVSPTSLSYGYLEGAKSVSVWNEGTGTLNWTLRESYSWLECSLGAGQSTGEHDEFSVTVDWDAIPEFALKTGEIEISSNGGSATVSVRADKDRGPRLHIDPTSIRIGASGSAAFWIENAGSHELTWSISENHDWLFCDAISGAGRRKIWLRAAWEFFTPGETKNGRVDIDSNGGSAILSVSATREDPEEPEISIQPQSLSFTDGDGPKYCRIWNSGDGSLTWHVLSWEAWFSVGPLDGTSSGERDSIRVSVNWDQFESGETKEGRIEIGSVEDEVTVPVTATNVGNPILGRHPASLALTYPEESDDIRIWNSGETILSWTISESCDWITCNPTNGSNALGEYKTVRVNVDWSRIQQGDSKECDIAILSNGGNLLTTVEASRPNPGLRKSHDWLEFDYDEGGKSFEVWNGGGGTLNWNAAPSQGWLFCSPASGSSTGEHDPISVTVDWNQFVPGQAKEGAVLVTSNSGNESVTIYASRQDLPPSLSRSPSSLSFTYGDGVKEFDIWNSGGGTLTWSVSESYGWLAASPSTGSSTGERDQVHVQIDWGELVSGETKQGSISISSNGGSSSVTIEAEKPNLEVLSAGLNLYVKAEEGHINPRDLTLHCKSQAWSEGQGNCYTPYETLEVGWGWDSSSYVFLEVGPSVIQEWYDGTRPNYGFVLPAPGYPGDSNDMLAFWSDEGAPNANLRPVLWIEYRYGSEAPTSVSLHPTNDVFWQYSGDSCTNSDRLVVGWYEYADGFHRIDTSIRFRISESTLGP